MYSAITKSLPLREFLASLVSMMVALDARLSVELVDGLWRIDRRVCRSDMDPEGESSVESVCASSRSELVEAFLWVTFVPAIAALVLTVLARGSASEGCHDPGKAAALLVVGLSSSSVDECGLTSTELLNSASAGSNDDWRAIRSVSIPFSSHTLSSTALEDGLVRSSRRGSNSRPDDGLRSKGADRRDLRYASMPSSTRGRDALMDELTTVGIEPE